MNGKSDWLGEERNEGTGFAGYENKCIWDKYICNLLRWIPDISGLYFTYDALSWYVIAFCSLNLISRLTTLMLMLEKMSIKIITICWYLT